MTETQALLASRQDEMEDYEAAMLAAWSEEWITKSMMSGSPPNGVRPLNAELFAYLSRFVGYNGPEINDERRRTYVQHKEREFSKVLFVAEHEFANGSPAGPFPAALLYNSLLSSQAFSQLLESWATRKQTEYNKNNFVALCLEFTFLGYEREYFADTSEERSIEHVAYHHELKSRDEVNDE
ncbi:unnamed protein product [Clonostachys chloroleuca]|uniref:Uncharacterized protein n=1 Tax=Clonostachys chloroleuca TaxID=1926264 RepID=A0AA35Q1R5_9HYPO|nr:unnamed protein product [Clonostachys chloroleuca]